jgi:hypothetical protein
MQDGSTAFAVVKVLAIGLGHCFHGFVAAKRADQSSCHQYQALFHTWMTAAKLMVFL